MTVGELKNILSKYKDNTHVMLTQYGSAFDIEYIDESKVIIVDGEKDYKDIKHLKTDRNDYIQDFKRGEIFINIVV